MESVATFLGSTLDYAVADRICCHNHRYAERRGYFAEPQVDLFSRLDSEVETVFYDSVCGIPLFVAPRGRSFDDFYEESLHHGWPSFRPEEIISENVIIHDYGRMESKCGTHLGHNLPQGGMDRYCIDLVCMAGMPLNSTAVAVDKVALTAEEFNATSYTSSAEEYSGKNPNARTQLIGIVVGSLVAACLLVMCSVFCLRFRKRSPPKSEYHNTIEKEDDWSNELTEEGNS